MAVPYYDRMLVDDIPALKALTISTTPAIDNGIFIGVKDRGDGFPAWYYYDSASTATSVDNKIVIPDSPTTGRWFLFQPSFVDFSFSNIEPTSTPPKYDGSNGGISFVIYNNGNASNLTVTFYIGVDSTGVLGNNGWLQTQNLFS